MEGYAPPSDADGADTPLWQIAGEGVSVKGIYSALCPSNQHATFPEKFWLRIWKWKWPQRIKLFAWKASLHRLPTRELVARRNGGMACCPWCGIETETLLHLLRDCRFNVNMWRKLLPASRYAEFFAQPWEEWLFDNVMLHTEEWLTLFWVSCWKIWKNRNEVVHGSQNSPADTLKPTLLLAKQISSSKALSNRIVCNLPIYWEAASAGVVKLNTDGASRSDPGNAGCGALLRNDSGHWLGGVSYRVGWSSAMQAEWWGVLKGLELAWNGGWRNILVEVDSTSVIRLLTSNGRVARRSHFVNRIRAWLARPWQVSFQHAFREANSCADWLANFPLEHPEVEDLTVFIAPPAGLASLLQVGLASVIHTRSFCIS